MENEREHSKFIIQRFDLYITGANTKGNFLLAINTFLIGVIITNYSKLIELIHCCNIKVYFNIGIVLLITLCITATYFILKSVYPFLLSGNSSKDLYHSHIFFNSIAEFKDANDFRKSFAKQTDLNVQEDMSIQAYQLAVGLKSKYKNLETSIKFIYAELVLIVILLTLIILF